jgi:hypothetical protein
MSNVTRLPPFPKTIHVEADIPISQRDEFERAIVDIVAASGRAWMHWIEIKINALLAAGGYGTRGVLATVIGSR